jgi:hypothetical protein
MGRGSANRAGAATVDWAKAQMCEAHRGFEPNRSPRRMTDLMPRSVFLSLSPDAPCPSQSPIRIMTTIARLPAIRIRPENPNHHLWNNHGTWFLHYTVYPTPLTKERIRRSLGTKDLADARRRRDTFFAGLAAVTGQFEAAPRKAVAA